MEKGEGKMENEERPRRDLRERTFLFARMIIQLYVSLDRGVLAQTLGRQVLRAGTSIGANYREADQARSKPEFIAKIGDCLKEADETAYWLELMAAENVVPVEKLLPSQDEAKQLVAILTTIKRHAEGKE
jgi:four helix bundle protein